MIEINLLPTELKKKKRAAPKIDVSKMDLQNLPLINIALLVVAGLVVIQLFLFIVGVITGMYFKTLDESYQKILPEKNETERLQLQIDRMGKKVAAIDELMVKRFSWAKKLNDLSDSITPGIWLTELEYNEKLSEIAKPVNANLVKKKNDAENKSIAEKVVLKYLIISGVASSMGEDGTALIGRFIKSLKENPNFYSDFSDIELGNIKREKMEESEVMTFRITCLFK